MTIRCVIKITENDFFNVRIKNLNGDEYTYLDAYCLDVLRATLNESTSSNRHIALYLLNKKCNIFYIRNKIDYIAIFSE